MTGLTSIQPGCVNNSHSEKLPQGNSRFKIIDLSYGNKKDLKAGMDAKAFEIGAIGFALITVIATIATATICALLFTGSLKMAAITFAATAGSTLLVVLARSKIQWK